MSQIDPELADIAQQVGFEVLELAGAFELFTLELTDQPVEFICVLVTCDRHPLHEGSDLVFQHGLGALIELFEHLGLANRSDLFPLFPNGNAFFWKSGDIFA